MRVLGVLLFLLFSVTAWADRILLIPLDSRPAAGQFAQMIARIADTEVIMPPYQLLGRFTDPGRCDAILDWLEQQDLSTVDTVIASADMVMYGGLIASRENKTTTDVALARIRRLSRIVRARPTTQLYTFSATMRLAPTATRRASKFRMVLAKYEEAKAKWMITKNAESGRMMRKLEPTLPRAEIDDYEATRRRNHLVQQALIRMRKATAFDYLVIGQDDARPYGPHVGETMALEKLVDQLRIRSGVFFCEGVDQHASVLLSRALLTQGGYSPRIRVVYSDIDGQDKFASFESKPIKESLRDQIIASGAEPAVGVDAPYDYTLFLNTPKPDSDRFDSFLSDLKNEIDQGFPTSVADIDLRNDGTANPRLFESLYANGRMMRLLAYAGWNTAGNTMGTSIPAANVVLLARRLQVNPLRREVAQREFLLHRFVNDYAYHKYTRPEAYRMIRASKTGTIEETYGADFDAVNAFVKADLRQHLDYYFKDQFLGRRFFAGTEAFVFTGLRDVRIWLPWPRAYEARLEFRLDVATP